MNPRLDHCCGRWSWQRARASPTTAVVQSKTHWSNVRNSTVLLTKKSKFTFFENIFEIYNNKKWVSGHTCSKPHKMMLYISSAIKISGFWRLLLLWSKVTSLNDLILWMFQTGDEMSKRAKFVFVTWVGPSVSVMKKAKMSTDKALMKDIIQVFYSQLPYFWN